MLRNPQTSTNTSSITSFHDDGGDDDFRDIHAVTPPAAAPLPLPPSRQRSRWDASSHGSSNLSIASDVTNSTENFTTMSGEFNALVLAGSSIDHENHDDHHQQQHIYSNNMDRIGEEEGDVLVFEESNPLAIVPDPDVNPLPSPRDHSSHLNNHGSSTGNHLMMGSSSSNSSAAAGGAGELAVHRVKKEEVEAKISAWETAKVANINNRFKREDAIISGWENEQVHKASSWMNKVQRKLEEKRAKAMEKMENEIAKARRKAEERRASAEGKRGRKVAKVLDVAHLMRAVGRPPAKRSFF